jgi:hypothetical protein
VCFVVQRGMSCEVHEVLVLTGTYRTGYRQNTCGSTIGSSLYLVQVLYSSGWYRDSTTEPGNVNTSRGYSVCNCEHNRIRKLTSEKTGTGPITTVMYQ